MRLYPAAVGLAVLLLAATTTSGSISSTVSAAGDMAAMSVSFSPSINISYIQTDNYTANLSGEINNLSSLDFSSLPLSTSSAVYTDLNSRIMAVNPALYVSNLSCSLFFQVNSGHGYAAVSPYCNYTYNIYNIVSMNSVTVNWISILPEIHLTPFFTSLPYPIQSALNLTENLTEADGDIQLSSMNYEYNSSSNTTLLTYDQVHNQSIPANAKISESLHYADSIQLSVAGKVQIQGDQMLFYSVTQLSLTGILEIAVVTSVVAMLVVLLFVRKNTKKS